MNRKLLEKKFLEIIEEDSSEFGEDITTEFTPEKNIKAKIISKSSGIISGISELKILFNFFNIKTLNSLKDGKKIKPNQQILLLSGNSHDILFVERTALNILSRMSGISTFTYEFLKKVKKINPKIKIAATRKTTPSFSYFEKKAVKIGGGDTHRFNLSDAVLIKDNHLKLFKNNVKEALKRAKENTSFTKKVEIEVSSLEEAIIAAKNGADIVMLDNFSPREIEKTVGELKKLNLRDKIILEASGGITLQNIEKFAKTGVDVISVGALTHSVKSLDFSLEIL